MGVAGGVGGRGFIMCARPKTLLLLRSKGAHSSEPGPQLPQLSRLKIKLHIRHHSLILPCILPRAYSGPGAGNMAVFKEPPIRGV